MWSERNWAGVPMTEVKVQSHDPFPFSPLGTMWVGLRLPMAPRAQQSLHTLRPTGSGSRCPEVSIGWHCLGRKVRLQLPMAPRAQRSLHTLSPCLRMPSQVSCGRPSSPRLLEPTAQYPVLETRLTVLSLTSQSTCLIQGFAEHKHF